ncbi:MAG TPA: hypothetical protein VMV90_16135 [Rectinemataceae bacterium]|nr:hypothetical protein [Rectinemataceae bacterium]
MPKTKVLVLYEDEKPDSERLGLAIAQRLDAERYEVLACGASALSVSELLASKVYIFGAEAPEAPSYGELARMLKGINLAGRRAAFFGATGAAVAWLRAICADSEVLAAHADLVGRRPESAALAAWLRGIAP